MPPNPQLQALLAALRQSEPGLRGQALAAFGELLHRRTPTAYFLQYRPEQLSRGTASAFRFLEESRGDTFHVRLLEDPAWITREGEERTVLEVTGPDQPFLVDSLRELVRAQGLPTHDLLHPIVQVRRDAEGRVVEVLPPGGDSRLTSFMHLETDRIAPEERREALQREAAQVFTEARLVVADFHPMLAKLEEVVQSLLDLAEVVEDLERRDEVAEAVEFLEWLTRAHFVFLGYREYSLVPGPGGGIAAAVRGSGLGILRDEVRSSLFEPVRLDALSPERRKRLLSPEVLTVRKTARESRVLRRTRMDSVTVKKFGAGGRPAGEHRLLGLFTGRALGDLPADIPFLRRKLDRIIERAGVVPGSHDHREIFSIFCSLPKPELFATAVPGLEELVLSVLENRDRLEVRVRYRRDTLERGVAVTVLLPRDRFSAEAAQEIGAALAGEFQGNAVDYRLALSDEPLARLHFYLVTPGVPRAPPLDHLERTVAEIVRTWDERVQEALVVRWGVEEGHRLARKYAGAFPRAYRAQEPPEAAAADIESLDRLESRGSPQASLLGPTPASEGASVLKIYRAGKEFHLSQLMPILTHLGLRVWDEVSFRVAGARVPAAYVHCFRVLGPDAKPIPEGGRSERVVAAILQVLTGQATDDALNRLITSSPLDWREVELLRTYASYYRQLEGARRQRTVHSALTGHPRAAEALVALVAARFDPALDERERPARERAAREAFVEALAGVPGIQEDQILRGYADLIQATVRTNYYQRQDGRPPPALALKIRSGDVQRMPDPRPLFEIFAASHHMEGIHLRSGLVARGGIRWSDRSDDFRTEILSLMRAQRAKNALIVPAGAKGGFVLKHVPRERPLAEWVREQYRVFIGALLDVTDNIVDGQIRRPPSVVAHDGDDPYLVVAADRGTAELSDTANEIARERSFWLGDAFASGGTTGYNHKQEGITARGAWECVKRHFRELGVDIEREGITVVGIGDMSGDVFGNGMLLSRKVRLVAAFDHRHIFLDPDPDAETSYDERLRLFRLPRSSWEDYDRAKISRGGGVFSRSAKSVPLSPEARRLLGVDATHLNGNELIRALLCLPVDLLFNGGIGTYIKASGESHLAVGDPANDEVRVDALQLRARVISEGGNLGITQEGRVELARRGRRINTDFIDNAGGVDLSDHEVNLKLLLHQAVREGSLAREDRDRLLRGLSGEVCALVIRDCSGQSETLSLEERRGAAGLDHLRFLASELGARGLLDRTRDAIPGDAEMRQLAEAGERPVRPQLAVLLACAKIDADTRLLATSPGGGEDLEPFLLSYFPESVASRFAREIRGHPLKEKIAVTAAVNQVIRRMGITFFHRLARDYAAGLDQVLRACVVASDLCRADEIERSLDGAYASGALLVSALYDLRLRLAATLEEVVRWCLRSGPPALPAREIAAGARRRLEALQVPGVPVRAGEDPSGAGALLEAAAQTAALLEVADLAARAGAAPETAQGAWDAAGERLLLGALEEKAGRIARASSHDWQTCSGLLDQLAELRGALAREILARQHREPAAGSPPAAAVRARARALVPDSHPGRRRLGALVAPGGEEPWTPSSLFVAVEEVRRLLEEVLGEAPPCR